MPQSLVTAHAFWRWAMLPLSLSLSLCVCVCVSALQRYREPLKGKRPGAASVCNPAVSSIIVIRLMLNRHVRVEICCILAHKQQPPASEASEHSKENASGTHTQTCRGFA